MSNIENNIPNPHAETKTFLGNLKVRERQNGTTLLTGIVYMENIQDIPADLIKTDKKGKLYFPVAILEKKAKDGMGNTHIIKVDIFQQPAKK